jgi:hypothetical protein
MATLIKADGSIVNVRPKDKYFTLEELYALVCAGDADPIVEAVPVSEGVTAWCHEEGKLRGLPVNAMATIEYGAWLAHDDYFVGDILITSEEEVD